LTGLYARTAFRRAAEPLIWVGWFASFVIVAALNRGGMLAMALSFPIVPLLARSLSRFGVGAVAALVLFAFIAVAGVQLGTGSRSISLDQISENVGSIVVEPDTAGATAEGLKGTRKWREQWWQLIIDNTVFGPYFWEGRGFGADIAAEDGFSSAGTDTRSPHNAHITILARSGVPGLALWLAVQAAFAVTVLRAAARAKRNGQHKFVAVLAWILAYWLAALVNMSFDAYLEGPQGGILFWSLVGAGLATAAMVTEPPYEARGRDLTAATP
jgi:O-antigen ligase